MAGGAADDHAKIEWRLAALEAQVKDLNEWKITVDHERDRGVFLLIVAKYAAGISVAAWGLLLWAKQYIRL